MKVCDVTGCRSDHDVEEVNKYGMPLDLCVSCDSLKVTAADILKMLNLVRRRERKNA